jgi:hypothetical protein
MRREKDELKKQPIKELSETKPHEIRVLGTNETTFQIDNFYRKAVPFYIML